MNKNSLPLFIGVIISTVVILLLINFTVVDNCLDNGGRFSYELGKCVLANGEVYTAGFTNYLVAGFFILAITLAFAISRFIKKRINK